MRDESCRSHQTAERRTAFDNVLSRRLEVPLSNYHLVATDALKMRAGSTLIIARVLLVSVLATSVTAKSRNGRSLGNCSALKGIKLRRCLATTRRNVVIELDMNDIPEDCEGSKDIEACTSEYNLIQTILAQHNLESVPKDCEGEDSDTLEKCLTEWDLTQIILGLSDTKIPPECEGLEKENKLKKCLQEHTLSPTSYPTPFPTTVPTTKSPTKSPTLQPIQIPIQPSSEGILFTTSSLGAKEAVLDIGTFLMSLTTYSQTSRDLGVLSREHELAAARQHLREVYEDAFHVPVVTVDLQFVDGGVTALSKSDSIQHSTFFGNATFVEEATHSLPTLSQLESETLKAFSGTSKDAFIKKYHFLATGAPSYFGVKYRYDVSVRKLNKIEVGNTAAATQDIQGIQGINEETKEASTAPSGMFVGVMIVFAFVVVVTLTGLAVLVRKRQLDRVLSAQNLHDDFILEEVNVICSNVGSDVSLSPVQLLEGDDFQSHSSESISHLSIDLSGGIDDDEKSGGGGSTWSYDSKRDTPHIDVELEIGSHCKELLSERHR